MNKVTNTRNYTRNLIEASLDPLVIINADGRISDLNEASTKVTGESREDMIGTCFSQYFTEPEKALSSLKQAIENDFVKDHSLTIKHKNGLFTDVLYNASVYKDEEGKVLSIFAAVRDVTNQNWATDLLIANKQLLFQIKEKEKREAELIVANKELFFQIKENKKQENTNSKLEALNFSAELASEYSRSLIEASRDPLITINPEGKITDMNAATIRLTGVSRKLLSGSDFFDYFTDAEEAREAYLEVFAKGSVVDSPLTLRHKDGKLTDVLFNGSVYRNKLHQIVGIVIVARDVTEQKKIEQELTNAKVLAELTTVIAEEAKRKAESATITAEEAMKAKQQFLSNMSHEIRTPMTAIIGFTKVLLKTELNEKQREYLRAIKVSGNAMVILINDILDLAKVDSGKLVFEQVPFIMEDSFATMLQVFELKIQEKNLSLFKAYDKNIPKVLIGDPMRLHQIILNLLSNAVKFTEKGSINVAASLENEDEEKVSILFSVEDTGIGIPDDKVEEIFENFQQASSGTSSKYGGTGLGLAIVKQLVEHQEGKVSVVSELGKGSTFSFILNFLKTDENVQLFEEKVELDNNTDDIKVLVVEDILLNQLLIKTLLDDFGFESDVASNGKIAIEKLKNNKYDIVLMDLQMPEMNGFEATEFIRKEMKLEIPIMALTADVTTVDIEKCQIVGMNDYLTKPVDEKLLYTKIIGLIKKARERDMVQNENESVCDDENDNVETKVTDLSYLNKLTKSNPALMSDMIALYLSQTPELIAEMNKSFTHKDWPQLKSSVHKMIPSFSIFGISQDVEKMARVIHQRAGANQEDLELSVLISALDTICTQACKELEIEIKGLSNK